MARDVLYLLESLMAGNQITPAELNEFLAKKHREELYFDFKDGKELEDKSKAAKTLRQYLSGFANSEGGILFVGVDKTGNVTGCPAPGGGDLNDWISAGGDLTEWASDCLKEIAPYFSPVPRFNIVKHQRGDVLVATTARSLGLVPCIEGGRSVYYFRFHDKTLPAPEYLVSDLILGRRQGAYLHISSFGLNAVPKVDTGGAYDLVLRPKYQVENQSLSWAEEIRLGLITFEMSRTKIDNNLNTRLKSYVDVREPHTSRFGTGNRALIHSVNTIEKIEPFQIAIVADTTDFRLPLRMLQHWYLPYVWEAAAYVIAKGNPPIWYQLSLTISQEFLQFTVETGQGAGVFLTSESSFIEIRRLSGERPVVAWEGI